MPIGLVSSVRRCLEELRRPNSMNEEEKAKDGQSDVASILARRVAVEMSDSDAGGPTDSEYDSDDWGDESTA